MRAYHQGLLMSESSASYVAKHLQGVSPCFLSASYLLCVVIGAQPLFVTQTQHIVTGRLQTERRGCFLPRCHSLAWMQEHYSQSSLCSP